MADLFGWEFKRKTPLDIQPSFAPKESDDGAVLIAAGGAFGTYVDLDGTVRTEAELVTKYREMSLQPECDSAVDEIVNEAMATDVNQIVRVNLDDVDIPNNVKNIVRDEFQNCLNIIDFNRHAYEIFRRWYVDGRLYYHVIIDPQRTDEGIKEIRYVDPRKIRKIREITKQRARGGEQVGPVITKTQNEYYVYNDKGFNYGNKVVGPTTSGLKIAKDAVLHVTSGLTDTNGTMVLSYLHKAIKPLNQLRTLEDALVIYRLARAPERRIWYIDVGNLPKMKAEQYVREIMVKHKNRLIYDADSGNVRDDRKFMTMLEDYWLPRREGGRGTEVTTLPGGQTLGQMDDVLYFQKRFYQTLNVPVNRLNSDALFSLGRATEVTRDELKFQRFVNRLRNKFSTLFSLMLQKQLVLKKVMTIEEYDSVSSSIRFEFTQDNHFTELKDAEILQNRVNSVHMMQDLVGRYYSNEWVRKNVLMQSEDDIELMNEQIKEETNNPLYNPPQDMMQDGQGQQADLEQQDSQPAQPAQGDDLQWAEATYKLLKGKKNRSMQEISDFKSAAEILAKSGEKSSLFN